MSTPQIPTAYQATFQLPGKEYEEDELVDVVYPPAVSVWKSGEISELAVEDSTVVYRKEEKLYSFHEGSTEAWPSDTLDLVPFSKTVFSVTRLSGGKERLRRHFGADLKLSKTIIESDKPIVLTRFNPSLGAYTTGKVTTVFAVEWTSYREILTTEEPVRWAVWLSSNQQQMYTEDECVGGFVDVLLYGDSTTVRHHLGSASASLLCVEDYESAYTQEHQGDDVFQVENIRDYVLDTEDTLTEQTDKGVVDITVAPPGASGPETEQVFYILGEDNILRLLEISEENEVVISVLSSDVRSYKAGKAGLVVYRDSEEDGSKRIIVSFYGEEGVQDLELDPDEEVISVDASFDDSSITVYYTSK